MFPICRRNEGRSSNFNPLMRGGGEGEREREREGGEGGKEEDCFIIEDKEENDCLLTMRRIRRRIMKI